MAKIMDIFSLVEVSLLEQAKNTLESSGYVEGVDFTIEKDHLVVKTLRSFDKIADILREVEFEVRENKPKIFVG